MYSMPLGPKAWPQWKKDKSGLATVRIGVKSLTPCSFKPGYIRVLLLNVFHTCIASDIHTAATNALLHPLMMLSPFQAAPRAIGAAAPVHRTASYGARALVRHRTQATDRGID